MEEHFLLNFENRSEGAGASSSGAFTDTTPLL